MLLRAMYVHVSSPQRATLPVYFTPHVPLSSFCFLTMPPSFLFASSLLPSGLFTTLTFSTNAFIIPFSFLFVTLVWFSCYLVFGFGSYTFCTTALIDRWRGVSPITLPSLPTSLYLSDLPRSYHTVVIRDVNGFRYVDPFVSY